MPLKPLYTEEFLDSSAFVPEEGASYIFGVSSEKRSEFAVSLESRTKSVNFVEIRETDKFVFEAVTPTYRRVVLRQRTLIESFVGSLPTSPIYIDITGLSHSVWAPLLRVLLARRRDIRGVYLEPIDYKLSSTPRPGQIYDLSDRIEGIEPIPLFTSLEEYDDEKTCFVPFLGFEGTRYAHMVEELQPPANKTFPIVGIPGFRPEYPFVTYLGNAGPLDRWGAHRNVRFAKSNCPFSAYYALEALLDEYQDHHLKAGLIGTKPHALGTIVAAIKYDRIEIVYDHVKRKKERTMGAAKCLVYHLSRFMDDVGGVN